jgi:hypothetical protein
MRRPAGCYGRIRLFTDEQLGFSRSIASRSWNLATLKPEA